MATIQGIGFPPSVTSPQVSRQSGNREPFQSILESEINTQGLKFSAHAEERMRIRNIHMSPEEIRTLSDAIDQVAQKGGHESLVVTNQAAYVVNVPQRTVITALGAGGLASNVFTQIDSAIIVS
jgi:flagellar operon protein